MKQKVKIYFKGSSHIRKKSDIVIFHFIVSLNGNCIRSFKNAEMPTLWIMPFYCKWSLLDQKAAHFSEVCPATLDLAKHQRRKQ